MDKKNRKEKFDNSDSTLTTIENFNLAFNKHDVDGVMNLMTEDCLFENTNPMPDGTRIEGAIKVREFWQHFLLRILMLILKRKKLLLLTIDV